MGSALQSEPAVAAIPRFRPRPAVNCPARLLCFRERCRLYNCMADVSVDSVVDIARGALQERSPHGLAQQKEQ